MKIFSTLTHDIINKSLITLCLTLTAMVLWGQIGEDQELRRQKMSGSAGQNQYTDTNSLPAANQRDSKKVLLSEPPIEMEEIVVSDTPIDNITNYYTVQEVKPELKEEKVTGLFLHTLATETTTGQPSCTYKLIALSKQEFAKGKTVSIKLEMSGDNPHGTYWIDAEIYNPFSDIPVQTNTN